MKALSTILLTLLVLGGCASTGDSGRETIITISDNYYPYTPELEGGSIITIIESNQAYSQELEEYLNLSYQRGHKAQARPINFDGTYYAILGHNRIKLQSEVNKVVLGHCEYKFQIKCLIAYEGNKFVWRENLINYKEEQVQLEIERKRKEEEHKQALIAEYIERCIEFGFEGKTEIATCFQQEVFNERQLAQQRLAQQPQIAQEEEVPFLLQMLGEIAIGVSEGYLEQVQHDMMHQNDRRPPIIFYPTKP